MLREVPDNVWAFDLEWVPDAPTGRRVYDLPADMPDSDVIGVMWERGGATDETPHPYLKTMLCRVVSVAAVIRRRHDDGRVALTINALPHEADTPMEERTLIDRFLNGIGTANPRPQLVGFNSRSSDLPILIQRGVARGVQAAGFSRRPSKPWDGYDYFSNRSDGHIDLKEIIASYWGKSIPSLHEFAAAAGIPGKIDTKGDNVYDLWMAGDIRRIVEYNQFDAVSTYLLWMRTAHFAGLFSGDELALERERVRELLAQRIAKGETHFERYLQKWAELEGVM